MGTSRITLWMFVVFEAVALFVFWPVLVRGIDQWHWLSSGTPAPVYMVILVSLALFVLLLLTGAVLLKSVSMASLSVRLPIVAGAIVSILALPFVVYHESTFWRLGDEKYLLVDAGPMSEDLEDILSCLPQIKLVKIVKDETDESRLSEITDRYRIYPADVLNLDRSSLSVFKLNRLQLFGDRPDWRTLTCDTIIESNLRDSYANVAKLIMANVIDTSDQSQPIQASLDKAMNSLYDITEPDMQELYLEGRRLYERSEEGDLDSAIGFAREALERDPSQPLFRILLAECFCQRYHRLWVNDPCFLDSAGMALSRVLDDDRGTLAFLKAQGTYFLLQATRSLRQVKLDSLAKSTHLATASTYYASADSCYRQALAKAPDNVRVLSNIGALQALRAGLFRDFCQAKCDSLKVSTCDSVLKALAASERDLNSAIKINPFYLGSYVNLGYLLGEKSKFSDSDVVRDTSLLHEAEDRMVAAARWCGEADGMASLYYNIACVCSLLGDYDAAEVYLDRALAHRTCNWYLKMVGDPDYGIGADRDLAGVYRKMGEKRFNDMLARHKWPRLYKVPEEWSSPVVAMARN